MSAEVKLSSKGQIVIPREVRKKMNLKPGDKVKIEAVKGRKATIQPAVQPPDDIFVRAGKAVPKKVLAESRRIDELNLKRLLRELGAEQ